jgi:hypothetical protein
MLDNAVHKYQADKEDRFVKHVRGWLASSSTSFIQQPPQIR